MLYALCFILYTLCFFMLYALCFMLYALCFMIYALCFMLYALCLLFTVYCLLFYCLWCSARDRRFFAFIVRERPISFGFFKSFKKILISFVLKMIVHFPYISFVFSLKDHLVKLFIFSKFVR